MPGAPQSPDALLALTAGVGVLFVMAVVLLTRAGGSQAEIRIAASGHGASSLAGYRRLVAASSKWSAMIRIDHHLAAAGFRIKAVEFLVISSMASIVAGFSTGMAVSKTLGWLVIPLAARACWAWVHRAQTKRSELLVAQLPSLSRMLANSAGAGLSLAAGLALAADELEDPLAGELWRTSERLRYGQSIEDALADLRERLPTAELSVMVTTLIIQHRRGGEIVGSLREMSATLEARKVLRGEIRTMMSGPMFTGYATMGMGAGSLLMLDSMSPGAVETMFSEWPGRIALAVAFTLFAIGGLFIRRATSIDL